MELKGTYKQSYTLDKEPKNLLLVIELKQAEGFNKLGKNVWEGIATLNGQPYTKEDLSHCVNARIAAERIGKQIMEEIKSSSKIEGHVFKLKKKK